MAFSSIHLMPRHDAVTARAKRQEDGLVYAVIEDDRGASVTLSGDSDTLVRLLSDAMREVLRAQHGPECPLCHGRRGPLGPDDGTVLHELCREAAS